MRYPKIFFVDAIAQRIGNAADDGATNLPGRHLAEFRATLIRIPRAMRSTEQIGGILQRAWHDDDETEERRMEM